MGARVSPVYLAHDQFVENYAEPIKVDQLVVRVPQKHLWRHVAWSAAGVVRVVGALDPRDAEVCQVQVPVFIEHQILWLDVSMNDALRVDVIES